MANLNEDKTSLPKGYCPSCYPLMGLCFHPPEKTVKMVTGNGLACSKCGKKVMANVK